MRISRNDLPVEIEAAGAVARRRTDFGAATDYGALGGEYFELAAGTDLTPLLEGLENDLCQSPHWGFLVKGGLTVTFGDGSTEKPRTGDLFYWPPGHTLRADEDTEFVLFSPQHEHGEVLEHVERKLES